MPEIDTTNHFLVSGAMGADREAMIHILRAPKGPITRAHALNLAAYLVAMAEEDEGEFQRVLEAVQNT